MKSTITFVIFIFFLSVFGFTQNCDNIILHSGLEISSVVEEIRLNEIAYRKCDNPTGPLYVILKSEVFLIKYKNGTSQGTAFTATTGVEYFPAFGGATDIPQYAVNFGQAAWVSIISKPILALMRARNKSGRGKR